MPVIAFLILTALIPPHPEAIWEWPTSGEHRVLRDYQAPLTPWGSGHRGLDLAATGDTIVAPVAGVVTFQRLGRQSRGDHHHFGRGPPGQHGAGDSIGP